MDNFVIYILALIIPLIAHIYVNITYNKSKNIKLNKNLTGYDVARQILDNNDLKDMYIVATNGKMSDHYDPKSKVVRLSKEVYDGSSVAAVAIAAHECGHAIQDKVGYGWMKVRSMIFPVVRLGTGLAYVILVIGIVLEMLNLIWLAIILVSLGLIFQLITLPVEFDASKRAKAELEKYNMVDAATIAGTDKMLKAAAYTYVAGVLSSALEILRLVLIYTRND